MDKYGSGWLYNSQSSALATRAGSTWTPYEDRDLLRSLRRNPVIFEEIAVLHGRTVYAIRERALKHLGTYGLQ